MDLCSSVKQLLLCCLVVTLNAEIAGARRAIPENNLAFPVLITLDSAEMASGFYMRQQTDLYFVTARHVLFGEGAAKGHLKARMGVCLSYPSDPNDSGHILLSLDLMALQAAGRIRSHEQGDAAVVRIGNVTLNSDLSAGYQISCIEGVRIVEHTARSKLVAVDADSVKLSDEVLVSNDVFTFGYPTSIGIREIPQLNPVKPLLRKGIVAGKGMGGKTIIVDCPTYYGNSGGPVLEVEEVSLRERRFWLIGLVSQFVPFTETWVNTTHKTSYREVSNSGYSVITPIDMILELLAEQESEPATQPQGDTR